jgi:N-acetylglutamate synthase-like GNAT family acetyltransferase
VSDKLIYKKAHKVDAVAIANLHKVGIPTGFLSKQSIDFLEALYLYLIIHEIVYVAKDKDKIVGFIAVSVNTSGLYKRFLKSNYMLLVKFALQNIFSLEFIKKAYETLNAPKKVRLQEMTVELPELLSIVVDDAYIGKGIGKHLLYCVEKELHSLGQEKYKVLVGSKLEANQFYVKNGFIILKDIELHKGESSYIYMKTLSKNPKVT